MKDETLRRVIVSFVLIILMCIVSSVFFSLAPSEWTYPNEVLNTHKACDWCQSGECDKYYDHCPQCCGGMTCDVCIERYRMHFNLTQETFPCYCWSCDGSAPNKIQWFFKQHF